MTTIFDLIPTENDLDILNFNYQVELTQKLDSITTDFNQEIINEIVLWKINRYVNISDTALELLNKIDKNDTILNHELTCDLLLTLLCKQQKGVRLAMASTFLRFKNPKIYQIIDQRAYRFLFGSELKYSESDLNIQIELYINYLQKLKNACEEFDIKFEDADRIFYKMDKLYNGELKINY